VEIFIETYLSETSLDEDLINKTLEEIVKAANTLVNAASRMKTVETAEHLQGSK
jgi:hypothetical protein